ncbi:MAG TPA: YdeI/OmpD-associated family protein [Gemmatimonadales bacterium]
MATTDPRVDAYIAKAGEFARPILTHLRDLVHAGCPGVEETMKWSTPHFTFHGVLGSMAAFNAHCTFGLWNGAVKLPGNPGAVGQLGRITSLSDLPPDPDIIALVQEAARLNEAGVKRPAPAKRPRKPLTVPPDLRNAMTRNPQALETFENLSPSHKREYIEWIVEAKGEEIRAKRVVTAVEWMAEGKPRNWKYMKR